MDLRLYDHQREAVREMKNGCILCGGVGTGKSRTSLTYYFCVECGGMINGKSHGYPADLVPMRNPKPLYIITTARKRDTLEWEDECLPFLLSSKEEVIGPKVVIDSWNNIGKYRDVENAFFIFDEQRVVGYGSWTKSFLQITSKNRWILLSATPGDTWSDYIPVFIANGFYKNKTDFYRRHVVLSRYTKFPKIEKYVNQGLLIKHRNDILVNMEYKRKTIPHHETIITEYNKRDYAKIIDRWNIYEDIPIENSSQLCYLMRRVVNSDPSRIEAVLDITNSEKKVIIFYNHNYELDILRNAGYLEGTKVAEWNGSRHDPIPKSDRWVYLVQYNAGAEGWNCIETNTMIFYSQNYSYRSMIQAAGRIDRLNTKFVDLYYYHLRSNAQIDILISKALKKKQNFNESKLLQALDKQASHKPNTA